MKKLTILLAASFSLTGCAASTGTDQSGSGQSSTGSSCMVTSQGNQVCGQAAVAWCGATQPERSNAENNPYVAANIKSQLQQTDADCATMGG